MLRPNDLNARADGRPTNPDTPPPAPQGTEPTAGPTTPRLHQPAGDGMDVEDWTNEGQIADDGRRGAKRAREAFDPSPDTYGEPELKARRTSAEGNLAVEQGGALPAPNPTGGPAPNSCATSSDAGLPQNAVVSPHAWLSAPRYAPEMGEIDAITVNGKPDLERLLALVFGSGETRPAEQFFVAMGPPLSDSYTKQLRELVLSCGALPVCRYDDVIHFQDEPLLYTAAFDRRRFTEEFLKIYRLQASDLDGHPEDRSEASESDGHTEDWELAQRSENIRGTVLALLGALGDREAIAQLGSEGAKLDFLDPNGKTLLMRAASQGDEELVRLLIHVPGIDPATTSTLFGLDPISALGLAALHGHDRTCDILLATGAFGEDRRFEALSMAAEGGHYEICKRLLKQDVSPNPPPGSEGTLTPLMRAARAGSLACCQLLLDAGAKAMTTDRFAHSVLTYAIQENNREILEFLLKEEPRLLGAPDALAAAASLNDISLMEQLLKASSDVTDALRWKGEALAAACESNAFEAANLLIQSGADPCNPNENALKAAVRQGNERLVAALEMHLIESKYRSYALYDAVKTGNVALVSLLLKNGYYHDGRWKARRNPLEYNFSLFKAAPSGSRRTEILGLLLEYGLSPCETDNHDTDLLMRVAAAGDPVAIVTLLERSFPIGPTDNEGRNALDHSLLSLDRFLHADDGSAGRTKEAATKEAANYLASLRALLESVPEWTIALLSNRDKYDLRLRPLTLELLFSECLRLNPPAMARVNRLDWDRIRQLGVARAGGGIDDVNRDQLNHALIFSGLPVAAVEFLAPYFDALPAMRIRLAGPAMLQSRPALMNSMLAGMLASMEKLMTGNGLDGACYSALPETLELPAFGSHQPVTLRLREALRSVAQPAISACIEYGVESEMKNSAAVIKNLFDTCIMRTWPSFQPQVFKPEAAPASGAISNEMQAAGIYVVLADAIDAAWRAAWSAVSATDMARAQALSPSVRGNTGASAIGDPGQFWDELAAALQHDDDTVDALLPGAANSENFLMDTQLREQLHRAFRRELAARVDTPGAGILDLPGQPPKVAALYADLVYRQLNLLIQFIDPPSLVGEATRSENQSM